MRCPECGSPKTQVVETREAEDSIRRRRRCVLCDHRFTTYERPEVTRLTVRGATGGERNITRSWLTAALRAAAHTLSEAAVQDVAADVEAQLRLAGQRSITTGDIAAVAAARLQLAALHAGGTPVRPTHEQVETALDASIPPPRPAPGPAQLALPLE